MKAIVLVVLCAGCVDVLAPDVGPENQGEPCTVEDSDPGTDVSYSSDIRGLFNDRCDKCHTPGGDHPIGISRGGLDLSTYQSLRAGGVHGTDVVVDGDPCRSFLRAKLDNPPPFGDRMPLNETELPAADKQLVSDWIVEGARDN